MDSDFIVCVSALIILTPIFIHRVIEELVFIIEEAKKPKPKTLEEKIKEVIEYEKRRYYSNEK